jgi:hypothetical protein
VVALSAVEVVDGSSDDPQLRSVRQLVRTSVDHDDLRQGAETAIALARALVAAKAAAASAATASD